MRMSERVVEIVSAIVYICGEATVDLSSVMLRGIAEFFE